ncbi:BTB/POZ domain-containing protein 19-like isoform X3 [Acipenser ruthenus]|nr:BTB/POZ domain-containing protein 19-like isoform X3 [Acipenser ruthenus]
MQAAVTYGQIDMKEKCLGFIENYTREIVKTRGFHELSDLALVSILQSSLLLIDELELLSAVREWANVNSVVLERPVPDVAKDIVRELRLFLLSPEELTRLENVNHKDNLIPWLKKRACNQEVPGSNPTSATDSLCDTDQVT